MRCRMQPRIDRTQVGSVTIDGKVYEHDALIRLGGMLEKRKKKLSRAVYGTSHTISLAVAKHLYRKGAIYFQPHRCQVELLPTPEVLSIWNQAEGAVIAMLHVTC
jgi:hypothetical protein